jgi:putative FmdB family regulatory protein
MPTYTYTCTKCDLITDVNHKMSLDTYPCNQCGGNMKRVPSAPAFKLIGDGWANQGYSGPSNRKKKEVK